MAISLGGRIGAVRAREKLSQAAFSRRLGVSQSYLSEVENDKSKPSVEMIIGIAMGFPKVGMKWLLTGIGNAVVEDGHGRPPSTTDDLRDILKEAQGLGLPLGNGEDGEGSPAQIKWPLSAEQEQILMSYLPVRTLLGVGREEPHVFSGEFDQWWQKMFPFAVTYGWAKAAMNCEATSIRLIKVDNDDLSPLVQRGSYGLLSLDQNSFNGKGFYAVFAALGVEVWLLSSQRGDEILLSRRNPSDLNSYIELNLDAEGIEILGKILWFISPSEAALVGVAAP